MCAGSHGLLVEHPIEPMSTVLVLEESKLHTPQDFEQIYRQYVPLVYRTVWDVLGSPIDAEGLLQVNFLSLRGPLRNDPREIPHCPSFPL